MAHVERLERLVQLLRKVDKSRFNIITFVGYGEKNDNYGLLKNSEISDQWREEYKKVVASGEGDLMQLPKICGTTACACGYAGLHPWFREQGFMTMTDGSVNYDGLEGLDAAEKFFELGDKEVDYLFTVMNYKDWEDVTDPNIVANRIEAFLRGEPTPCDEDEG